MKEKDLLHERCLISSEQLIFGVGERNRYYWSKRISWINDAFFKSLTSEFIKKTWKSKIFAKFLEKYAMYNDNMRVFKCEMSNTGN